MGEWIKCSERLPPPCVRVWAFRQRMPGMARTVEPCFISTHPKECVDDCNITHWQLLMAPEKPNDEPDLNIPPLPEPVGMHAPAGPNGDKYPVWHRGQMLGYARAAVLKERQEIADICDRVKEQRFASGNVREGSTARTLAEIIRNRT